MDYAFKKNTYTSCYYAEFSMGHEIIGRWLQDEISDDTIKLKRVLHCIAEGKTNPNQEIIYEGKETNLTILSQEVTIELNTLADDHERYREESLAIEDSFDLYDCESVASCGLDDFIVLINQWCEFVGYLMR